MKTINTIKELDKIVLDRLRDGAGQARLNELRCAYRTASGLACAVGCTIPDEIYDPCIEDFSVIGLFIGRDGRISANPPLVSSPTVLTRQDKFLEILNTVFPTPTPELLERLKLWQHRHDNIENWSGKNYIGPTK